MLAPLLFVGLLSGCGDDRPAGTSASVDTAAGGVAFTAGVLTPAFTHANSSWPGVALLDYDGDGWLDIFLSNGRARADALYRNQGDGSFVDEAAAAGVADTRESGAVVSGDLDNDGDPDLVVHQACSAGTLNEDGLAVLDGALTVWLNQGDGTFAGSDLTLQDDAHTWCTATLNLADLDGDGVLDLISATQPDPDLLPPWAFAKHEPDTDTVVALGDGAGGFTFNPDRVGSQVAFVTAVFDADDDGDLEFVEGTAGGVVTVDAWERAEFGGATQHSGRGLWMGLAVADFDGEPGFELYGTNMGLSPFLHGYDNLSDLYQGEAAAGVSHSDDPTQLEGTTDEVVDFVQPFHTVLELQDGGFVPGTWTLDAPQLLAGDLFDGMDGRYPQWVDPADLARQGWGWAAVPLDVDADGWVDVAWTGNNCSAPLTIVWDEAAGASPGGLLRNQEGTGFEDLTWALGLENVDASGRYVDGRALATGDLNNDGYADLVYANRGYNPTLNDPLAYEPGVPRVWLSEPRAGHWLQLDLVGTLSNRDGVGAVVEIDADGRTTRHAVGAGGALSSSSERLLTVGLGDATTATVRVRFPSGVEVEEVDVAADQRLVIEEPA